MAGNNSLLYFQQPEFSADLSDAWPILASIVDHLIITVSGIRANSKERLFELARWPHQDESSDLEYYPVRDVVRLIHAFEYLFPDIDLALYTVARSKASHYGLAGLLALTSSTVGDLLRMQIEHRKLIACFGYNRSYYEQQYFVYEWSPINQSYRDTHYLQRMTFLFWIKLIRELSDQKFQVSRVEFSFDAPKDLDKYTEVFGHEMSFSHDVTKMFIESQMLKLPLNEANPSLHSKLKSLATPILKSLVIKPSCESKMRVVLASLLSTGEANLANVAQAMGLAKRTLQRQLSVEQTSFGFVLDDYRKERAQYYLLQTSQSILDISLSLGYSDSNSLNSAFRNWFNISPSEYRRCAGQVV